jgi:alpha-glucosidase
VSDPRERWWEGAAIYQIYPRSFADANGDGIGDLRGIIDHLDHLRGTDASLGVDAIWLSPIFPSPLHDFGYDISDYTDVAAEFGTLADLDALIAACHARGLKLLLDLVPNHTSIEHPWFVESRASRESARRNWYTWVDPAPDGGPPNNWRCAFGPPAWTLDETTGQYYLHSFYPEQPDLNYRNPAVADAIHDVMRFWFRRGVDGFRVDAVAHVLKDPLLRDNPPYRRDSWMPGFGMRMHQDPLWNMDRPEVHGVVRGLRRVADEFPGRVLLGEIYTPVERLAGYLGEDRADEFQLAFDFELLHTPWDWQLFMLAIERAEALHPPNSWPTYALSNHDNPRAATRYGRERARIAAFLLLMLRGVPVLYQGEEIGMVDAPPSAAGDRVGRDAQRTPMQWDASPSGGFSTGAPWLPLVDPAVANVAEQSTDPASLLSLYRRLLRVRADVPAVRCGTHRSIFGLADGVLAWLREHDGQRVLVVCNLSDGARVLDSAPLRRFGLPDAGDVLVATSDRAGRVELRSLQLEPLEGLALSV